MNRAHPVVAVGFAVAVAVGAAEPARAETPAVCIDYSPLGFCLDWGSPGTEDPGTPGASGGGDLPTCYWVNLDSYVPSDSTIYVDYGIEPPPEGVEVVWQTLECSDGTIGDDMRWIIPPGPRDIAEGIRGRIAGTLPGPTVASSPADGVPAIVGMPVFVEVTNWTGVVTVQECAGFCVTVRAEPSLSPDRPTCRERWRRSKPW